MTDLERTYNALAEAIEVTLRHPGCDGDIGRQLIDLHVEIVAKLCPPQEHHNVMGGAWGTLERPRTMREAMETIANHRAAWASQQTEMRSEEANQWVN